FDPRKNDRLQRPELQRVGKDDDPEPGTADLSLRVEQLLAPALHDPILDLLVAQCLVPRLISGNDARPVPGEHRGHGTLAAADPANQSDHRLHSVPAAVPGEPGAGATATGGGEAGGAPSGR